MIKDIFRAVSTYFEAIKLSFRYGWWKHFLLPGLLALIIAVLVGTIAWTWGDNLASLLWSWVPDGQFRDFGAPVMEWVGRFMVLGIGLVIFKYLLLIILAPFMSILSERVERDLRNFTADVPFTVNRLIKDTARGLRLSIRNILRELFWVIVLSMLGLFGVTTIFIPVLIFLVQSYFAGFGNMDYALERHFGVRDSVRFVKAHKGLAIGNGLIYMLLISTVIGIFFAPTLSAIAATVNVSDALDDLEIR